MVSRGSRADRGVRVDVTRLLAYRAARQAAARDCNDSSSRHCFDLEQQQQQGQHVRRRGSAVSLQGAQDRTGGAALEPGER
jgi:hypothetical protein